MSRPGEIEDYLRARIGAGDFPGAAWLVARGESILAEGAAGLAVVTPETQEARPSTLYDLASLTKPVAGAILAARLASAGRLALHEPLSRRLPEWAPAGDASRITLLDLLTHRSGLPAWRPTYIHAPGPQRTLAWLQRQPLESPPGDRVLYSDLGYMLLGMALERAGGAPLDRLLDAWVTGPLGVRDLLYRPGAGLRPRIAATERGNHRERFLAGREGDGYNGWRTEVAWGEVHDLNARAFGGVSAHAGLFGTARAVLVVARAILATGDAFLDEERRDLMTRNLTRGLGDDRTLGFRIATSSGSPAGTGMSPRSFGHTGFTGTSLWIDPETGTIAVLLTNRVHPEDKDIDMNAVRREFHGIAAAL